MKPAPLKLENAALGPGQPLSFELGAGESLKIVISSVELRVTLWSLLFGLDTPTSGSVTLFGSRLPDLPETERLAVYRRVGAVPESGGLISNLKTWENILLPAALHRDIGVAAAETPVVNLFRAFGYSDEVIEALMGRLPDGLSLMEKRLAAFSRSQLMDPDLMIYEFPFTGLTREATGLLMDQARDYHGRKQGRASLYILPDDASSARVKTDHTLALH